MILRLEIVEGQKLYDLSSSFHTQRSLSGDRNSKLFPGKVSAVAIFGSFFRRRRTGKGFEMDFVSEDHAYDMHQDGGKGVLVISKLLFCGLIILGLLYALESGLDKVREEFDTFCNTGDVLVAFNVAPCTVFHLDSIHIALSSEHASLRMVTFIIRMMCYSSRESVSQFSSVPLMSSANWGGAICLTVCHISSMASSLTSMLRFPLN